MDKLKMHSPDITQQNIEKLIDLFPNCKTEKQSLKGDIEVGIDFDLLKQELSKTIIEGPKERYQLNWPGKKEALLTANAPISKTLRPCREESVDFDTTENLFIEGDNLEALKLLQETYLGKVKMIYIDPPYNTGKDFIYADDFAESTDEYLQESGQKDELGNRLVANTDSNGRFHSDWLSMMYSRLKVARSLLKVNGVIFISIDDGEAGNVRKLCDEIFGGRNFIADIIWQKKFSRANDATYFSTMHDHIFCYAKNSKIIGNGESWELKLLPRGEELPSGYSNPDDDSRGDWTSVVLSAKSGSDNLKYKITTPSGRECYPPDGRFWSVNKDKFEQLVADGRIWFGKDGNGTPRLKTFLSEVQDGLRPNSIWFHQDVGHNQEGRQEVKKLFDDKAYFDSPKPIRLLDQIIKISNVESKDIVLDFFAGSATTAHAVMQANSEERLDLKFIMVQLPELCDEKSEAFKAGYSTIAEISKERIRRAGKKIKEENPKAADSDTGFRVLKIDSSNMNKVYYTPDATSKGDLFNQVEHIKSARSNEDLLFQVMLDWGVDLSLPLRSESIEGKAVYFVNDDDLIACFDQEIDEPLIKSLAAFEPLRVVFRDDGFVSDSVKINAEQIFKQLSPSTDIKVI